MTDNVTLMIAKTNAIVIDLDKFNEEVNKFVYLYGLKQLLNDAGSAAKGADEKLAMAQKKLDALYEGKVRSSGGGSAKAAIDPVQAEAERLAWDAIKVALKASGRKASDVDDEAKAKAIEAYLGKNPETLKQAKARVEALAKTKSTVDLGDLGL